LSIQRGIGVGTVPVTASKPKAPSKPTRTLSLP
jgi:hypothetical protein